MNEPDFEQMLRSVTPAPPRRSLEDRVAAELAAPSTPTTKIHLQEKRSWVDRLLPALGWSTLGATAAIATMLAVNLIQERPGAPTGDLHAKLAAAQQADVALEHQVLQVADGEIIEESDDGISRLVRYESLERRRWVDADGAVMVTETPREDLVRIPIPFQ